MALTVSDTGGGNFKRVPTGVHIARCYSVADLGTHTQHGQFGTTTNRKVRLAWEIFGDDDNGEPLTIDIDGAMMPLTINKTYTFSLGEKASLRKDLSAWRGRDFTEEELKGFDLKNIVGVYCMLNVAQSETNGKTYANVAGISPLHKSMAKPDPVHKNAIFDLDNPDMEIFGSFYEKLQEYIKESPEWASANGFTPTRTAPAGDMSDMTDDIPF